MQLGIYSFGNVQDGSAQSAGQRLHDLLEEIQLADEVGLDVYGIGEHHRPDFAVSAPAVLLAAAAAKTKRIQLTSAVTVLSSDDPVRVFQQFATLDLISNGRAEITAGRGSFIESFPLFGYDLRDYDDLFAEKLELLLQLRDNERITWSGEHRAALRAQGVYPRPTRQLPVWVAVGGTPQSVIRAAQLGLPLALAIIGGAAESFVPFVKLYREAASAAGHDPATLPISINSPGYLADNSKQAADESFLPYKAVFDQIGRERGWGPMSRAQFDQLCGLRGAFAVGDPQAVIEKILYQHELFGHQRFLVQIDVGRLPHDKIMHAIELFGTIVAPAVRKALA
jgi:probable LLM family oxidoreductase